MAALMLSSIVASGVLATLGGQHHALQIGLRK
jgi:hypothetical protein